MLEREGSGLQPFNHDMRSRMKRKRHKKNLFQVPPTSCFLYKMQWNRSHCCCFDSLCRLECRIQRLYIPFTIGGSDLTCRFSVGALRGHQYLRLYCRIITLKADLWNTLFVVSQLILDQCSTSISYAERNQHCLILQDSANDEANDEALSD